MKLVTGATMQQIDRRTIEEFGIPGIELMEHAGRNCAEHMDAVFGMEPLLKVVVVAGLGNNGGDGYVIARALREKGWETEVLLLGFPADIAGDALVNLERLPQEMVFACPTIEELVRQAWRLEEASVIVDAIFGTGLQREVTGLQAAAIDLMNRAGRPILAVDIPSGVHAGTGAVLGCAVRAERTITFGLPKLGQVLSPGAELCGRLVVMNIGIPEEVLAAAPGVDLIDLAAVVPLLQPRSRNSHKGQFGHCLLVAGSVGKSGAAAMAANSAVRSGAGMVTAAVPASINAIMEVKTTEAMTLPIADHGHGFFAASSLDPLLVAAQGKTAVAIGPGIAANESTIALVHGLVKQIEQPLVLDADALNALATDVAVLQSAASKTIILTPHPGEMARLTGTTVAAIEADRIGAASRFAQTYGVYLILKGARTIIAAPDGQLAINTSGNPGMATGGMGDLLTGLLVALLAQGYSPWTACRLGVFVHGLAGDRVAQQKGEMGMSAVDVQEELPYTFKHLAEYN